MRKEDEVFLRRVGKDLGRHNTFGFTEQDAVFIGRIVKRLNRKPWSATIASLILVIGLTTGTLIATDPLYIDREKSAQIEDYVKTGGVNIVSTNGGYVATRRLSGEWQSDTDAAVQALIEVNKLTGCPGKPPQILRGGTIFVASGCRQ